MNRIITFAIASFLVAGAAATAQADQLLKDLASKGQIITTGGITGDR